LSCREAELLHVSGHQRLLRDADIGQCVLVVIKKQSPPYDADSNAQTMVFNAKTAFNAKASSSKVQ
jgi:hypothetical protein